MWFRECVIGSAFVLLLSCLRADEPRRVQQRTTAGVIEGRVSADGNVRSFLGVPYAAPPIGALRWQPPQPVTPWEGVRQAATFGPRPMQGRIFDDMVFRDAGPSEDCLYLNVWIPEHHRARKLPVMVWIYGGGYVAGATSEPRQDGSMLCQKGVVVVSMNYRLGIFGFLAHPELTKESPHHASGNYGLMDQIAALQWVRDNIGGFGGDPGNVTIFGESAGSESVSALVASPLARGLFHKAIGESGALFSLRHPTRNLAKAEAENVAFAQAAYGTSSLAALRALPAQALLDATVKDKNFRMGPTTDGYVLPADLATLYSSGRQAHVPLLAGWNRDEGDAAAYFRERPPTLANFVAIAQEKFGARAAAFLRAYHATNDTEARRAAADFEGDEFIAYATWKWMELHRQTSGAPVFRYEFDETLPLVPDAPPGTEPSAPHASDIEYVFRVLPARAVPWTPEHHAVSERMAAYWTNFARSGDPNGPDLPKWPRYQQRTGLQVMHLEANAHAAADAHRARYFFLEGQ